MLGPTDRQRLLSDICRLQAGHALNPPLPIGHDQ